MPTIARCVILLAALAVAADAADGAAPPPTVPGPVAADRPFGIGFDAVAISVDGAATALPVLQVDPGSTAASMGVRVGDRITAINGVPTARIGEIRALVPTLAIGAPVSIDLVRDGGTKNLLGSLRPAATVQNLAGEVSRMREELAQTAQAAKRQPTLAEVLGMLVEVEQQLPKAVAEFRKQYPDGEFDVSIRIHLVSDQHAEHPVDLVPERTGGPARNAAAPDPGAAAPDAPAQPPPPGR